MKRNKGTFTEQVQIQEELQSLGYNTVECCSCEAVFHYRKNETLDDLKCPICKKTAGVSDFQDLWYSGMPEHLEEVGRVDKFEKSMWAENQ